MASAGFSLAYPLTHRQVEQSLEVLWVSSAARARGMVRKTTQIGVLHLRASFMTGFAVLYWWILWTSSLCSSLLKAAMMKRSVQPEVVDTLMNCSDKFQQFKRLFFPQVQFRRGCGRPGSCQDVRDEPRTRSSTRC